MESKPSANVEARAERRKHPRAETTPRYRRLRAEIEPPQAFVELGRQLAGWLGRVRSRMRIRNHRNRRAVS